MGGCSGKGSSPPLDSAAPPPFAEEEEEAEAARVYGVSYWLGLAVEVLAPPAAALPIGGCHAAWSICRGEMDCMAMSWVWLLLLLLVVELAWLRSYMMGNPPAGDPDLPLPCTATMRARLEACSASLRRRRRRT